MSLRSTMHLVVRSNSSRGLASQDSLIALLHTLIDAREHHESAKRAIHNMLLRRIRAAKP